MKPSHASDDKTHKKKRDVEHHDVQPTAPPAAPKRPAWRQPEDWREAAMAAENGTINNAAEAQKILDALNGITWDTPKPLGNPPSAATRVTPPSATPTSTAPRREENAPRARTSQDDDCECLVLGLGTPNPDCAACGGTGYIGP